MTPLLEMEDLPLDVANGKPTRTLERHCSIIIPALVKGWGTTRSLFIDSEKLATRKSTSGVAGSKYVFDGAASAGLKFIPVVGLGRKGTEIKSAVAHGSRGICLRLGESDLASPSIEADVDSFMQKYNLQPKGLDLVLDLASICDGPQQRVQTVLLTYLASLPHIKQWRTLTLVASAFPSDMSGIQKNTTATFSRTEWIVWNALLRERKTLLRLPTFGDYGIQHPIPMEGFDPRYMAVSANIRYALDNEWLIVKGQSTKVVPAATQYPVLATTLISRPEYMQQAHCTGCDSINSCAKGVSGFGSASVWRRIGTVQHLTHTTNQISQLASP